MFRSSENFYGLIFSMANRENDMMNRIYRLHKIFSLQRFKGDFENAQGSIQDEFKVQFRFVGIK